MAKLQELREELQNVLSGRGIKLLDTLLPLVLFLVLNQVGSFPAALVAALGTSLALIIYRLLERESLLYAVVGAGGAAVAAGAAFLSGTGSGFFLPGLISGGLTVLICGGSALLKRPVTAFTSHLTRQWPLAWYWHDRVRPAYSEVSWIWAAAFGARTGLEYLLFQREAVAALGAVRILLGWPFTILVLVLSYLYGTWRLGTLDGPSVEEFQSGEEPPWTGQKRGF